MKVILFIFLSTLLSGCVNNSLHRVDDPDKLKNIKSIYVDKLPADRRGINQLIVTKLVSMGYKATTDSSRPDNIDAVITYRDKWRWDITTYMLSIYINVRDPETGFPIASGTSLHTSITRKTPNGMVNEVLTNIFYSK